jgi:hypothetical protein
MFQLPEMGVRRMSEKQTIKAVTQPPLCRLLGEIPKAVKR